MRTRSLTIPLALVVFILVVTLMKSWTYLISVLPFPLGLFVGNMICTKGWAIRDSKSFWFIVLFGFLNVGIEVLLVTATTDLSMGTSIIGFGVLWYFGGLLLRMEMKSGDSANGRC